jgi:ribosomal protein S26
VILHTCVRKNIFRLKLAAWNLEFCNSCVVLLRNVQVPRRNSDSHLVCCDHSHLRAKKTYLEESWRLGTSNSVILASFYFEMCKFHDEIPIRTKFAVILHTCERKNLFRGKLAAWKLEFCNSCIILLRNVQVPRRNSDSHLVCCDPSQLRAKKRI